MRLLRVIGFAMSALLLRVGAADAAQSSISGPPGSMVFGERVAVLPSGNIVVVDSQGVVSQIGAVYLYSPDGALISTLTGSSANDLVGSGGIVVLTNGNFIVLSPDWNNGAVAQAGAATWVNGTTGLNGTVAATNSLVGSAHGDAVGSSTYALTNGNYVVVSSDWNNGSAINAGAVSWGDGLSGLTGIVSASNSLVGSSTGDEVGGYGIAVLTNGNYVIDSPSFRNGASMQSGAATWVDGGTGAVGNISASNSLLGTTSGDAVGSPLIVALSNGNYVVAASSWNNGVPNSHVGAVIWGDGSTGRTGLVSAANALHGSTIGDGVGRQVVALSNGNYVVRSENWSASGAKSQVGAVTWANGASGMAGAVTSGNSLVGSVAGDYVGQSGVYALTNGNYVVASPACSINGVSKAGAVTWGSGSTGIHGAVTGTNSLVGTTLNDEVGSAGVTALNNGNYVADSNVWNRGSTNGEFGAVTWGDGAAGVAGPVGTLNSFIGSSPGDQLGFGGVTALTNGNYVVATPDWHNTGVVVGAVTLLSGSSKSTGVVSQFNSLTGSLPDALSGMAIVPLDNGNFVASFQGWNNGVASGAYGAVSWRSGTADISQGSTVTLQNSLVGNFAGAHLGGIGYANGSPANGVTRYAGSVYAVAASAQGSHPGSVTLADGRFGAIGMPQSYNTVYGDPDKALNGPVWDQDRQRLLVGFPDANKVVLISFEQIFAGRFE